MSRMKELVKQRGCTPMGEYKCQVPMPILGRIRGIDYCIADIVAALNAANITTLCSCCGHGDESIAQISLEDGRELFIKNHSPKKEEVQETEPAYTPCLHCSETQTESDDEGYKYCIHCGHRRMGQKPEKGGE